MPLTDNIAVSLPSVTTAEVLERVRRAMRLPPGAIVAVAMSGGVDSSCVAGLLVEAGYQVFGLTARLYDVDLAAARRAGSCCAPEDARDAREVAQTLGIRHYAVDEREAFAQNVIEPFAQAWLAGETPNPCVACNQFLKFDRLVEMARDLGAEALATGHYARLELRNGRPALLRGADLAKDQAYFLYPLPVEAADYLRFPLGELTKPQVRDQAERLGLPTAAKRESMDICFVGAEGTQAWLDKRYGARSGPLLDAAGTRLGQHAGVTGFTVGQRQGLGLQPRGPQAEPWYVIDKRGDGSVVVGQKQQLQVDHLYLDHCLWISGTAPSPGEQLAVQIRHRGQAVPCEVRAASDDGRQIHLAITGSLQAAARGQSGVLLQGDQVLGGGIISQARGPNELANGTDGVARG